MLQETLYKLHLGIINRRMKVATRGRFHPHSMGFIDGGKLFELQLLRTAMFEYSRLTGTEIAVLRTDGTAAFDSVKFEHILDSIRRRGAPPEVLAALHSALTGHKATA